MKFAGYPCDIKSLTDSGHIEGLLAGFGDVDHGGDKLMPGSMTKTLAARSTPLPMLLHHDFKRPIGAWQEWQNTDQGLYVKGALTLSVRDAQEALALAKDGALNGMSVGWKAVESHIDTKGVRVITEAELFEGSLVTVPMHDRTRVTSIKSIVNARDIAEILQEAGVSSRRAKLAAGAAWKVMNQQTDENAADEELAAIFTQSMARISALAKG